MTVLISGGTGFVGLNLAEALLARGERVVLFALDAPPEAALRRFRTLPGTLLPERGDIRDTAGFAECLRRHQVDRLFPFAAVTSGPDREREAPERVLEVNLLGVVSQLRAARDVGIRRVVAPSSSAVYGESFYTPGPMREDGTPPVPISLYGISKYALERTALRLGALWGLDVVAARIGALFGPWERDTGLRDSLSPFWQLEQAARAGREAVLPAELPPYGWVYARDAAAALLHLLDLPPAPADRVFNICSGDTRSDLLPGWCRTLAIAHPGFRWQQSDDPAACTIRLNETRPRAAMSIERLRATGWEPRFPPDRAFADFLAWSREGDA
ncbi:NAD-dependent epimerase/dehydratase family protein [Roseomonas sp. BN140053]|uniref:NAD-dependent epimerase/dehydratase family protein n=1 Tax=Roseomonas sp. BN140053 TaxID=3391898 RepID=UPI0039ED24BF